MIPHVFTTTEFWAGALLVLIGLVALAWAGWRYLKSLEAPLTPTDEAIVRDITLRTRQHQRQREVRP